MESEMVDPALGELSTILLQSCSTVRRLEDGLISMMTGNGQVFVQGVL